MKRRWYGLAGLALALIFLIVWAVVQTGRAQTGAGDGTADPQRLLIPRWFLSALTVDGSPVDLGETQQTIQFEPGDSVNGTGACNSFSGSYEATPDGAMGFSPMVATEMACDALSVESAYFKALSQVTRYNTENYELKLSSADGKTVLVYRMPPK